MIIRLAKPSDRKHVAAFTAKTFPWGDYITQVWKQWINNPNARLVVAEHNHKPIGIMYIEFRETGIAYLAGARVHSGFRGKGAGRKMLEKCLQYAKQQKIKKARLATVEGNIPAIKLAESIGFKKIETYQEVRARKSKRKTNAIIPQSTSQAIKILQKIDENPLEFSLHTWKKITEKTIKTYINEELIAIDPNQKALTLYEPIGYPKQTLMINYLNGEREAVENLAKYLKHEAYQLNQNTVWGFIKKQSRSNSSNFKCRI